MSGLYVVPWRLRLSLLRSSWVGSIVLIGTRIFIPGVQVLKESFVFPKDMLGSINNGMD